MDKVYPYPAAGGAVARLEARGYVYDQVKDIWFIPGIPAPQFRGNIVRDNLRIVHEVLDRYDEEKGINKSVHLKRLKGRYLHDTAFNRLVDVVYNTLKTGIFTLPDVNDAALLAAIMLEQEKKIKTM